MANRSTCHSAVVGAAARRWFRADRNVHLRDRATRLPRGSADGNGRAFSRILEQLQQELNRIDPGDRVLLICSTESECRRLHDLLDATAPAREQRLELMVGSLRHGFHLLDQQVIVLNAAECLLREDVRRKRQRHLSKRIDSFLDLKPGELVVHLAHGIGRFRGMEVLRRENQTEEHLVVEFAGGTKVYVPSTRIHLVQKYVGGKTARPRLATLGGLQWQKRKQAADRGRDGFGGGTVRRPGGTRHRDPALPFAADSEWQAAFDACLSLRRDRRSVPGH